MARSISPKLPAAPAPSRSTTTPQPSAEPAVSTVATTDSFAHETSASKTSAGKVVPLPTLDLGEAPRSAVSTGAPAATSTTSDSTTSTANLADPSLMTAQQTDKTYTYRLGRFDGPLFGHVPAPSDIHQGVAGDCYFLSSLAAIAQAEPHALYNLIHDNRDGTYTVHFHTWNADTHHFDIQKVTVDADLYASGFPNRTDYNWLTYDSPTKQDWQNIDTPDLWGPLMEKAYAQWKGGSYEDIGEGGWPADAMQDLLGRKSESVHTSDGADTVWKLIQSAVDSNSPICASTQTDPAKQSIYTNSGIVGCHAYTVMGCEERDGTRYVKLRNPWGQTEPKGNGPDDGVFEIPLTDFLKYYDEVDASLRHPEVA